MLTTGPTSRPPLGGAQARHRVLLTTLGVLVAVIGLAASAASAATGAQNGVAAINPETGPAVEGRGPVSPALVGVSGLLFDDGVVVSLVTPSAAPGAAGVVNQPGFAPGKWLTHFEKHGASNCWGGNCLGYANSVDYLRGAQNLTRGGPGVQTFVRKSGDTLFYRSATNEFAVLTKDNVLRTYFKPGDGLEYWLKQIGGG